MVKELQWPVGQFPMHHQDLSAPSPSPPIRRGDPGPGHRPEEPGAVRGRPPGALRRAEVVAGGELQALQPGTLRAGARGPGVRTPLLGGGGRP